jgi:hypothetical protein
MIGLVAVEVLQSPREQPNKFNRLLQAAQSNTMFELGNKALGQSRLGQWSPGWRGAGWGSPGWPNLDSKSESPVGMSFVLSGKFYF